MYVIQLLRTVRAMGSLQYKSQLINHLRPSCSGTQSDSLTQYKDYNYTNDLQ